jgi:hypothetical protein
MVDMCNDAKIPDVLHFCIPLYIKSFSSTALKAQKACKGNRFGRHKWDEMAALTAD